MIVRENTKSAGFQELLPSVLLIVIPNTIQLNIAALLTAINHQILNFIIITPSFGWNSLTQILILIR
jgi:hypothetical protein